MSKFLLPLLLPSLFTLASNKKIIFRIKIFLIVSFFLTFTKGLKAAEGSEGPSSSTPRLQNEEKMVPHPLANKGLIRIKSDGSHIYQTPVSDQNRASSVRLGMLDPIELSNPETGVKFTSLYEHSDMPLLLFDYEWQVWRGLLGKLGWKIGSGIYVTNGNGSFKSTDNAGIIPKESFTFFVFPNNIAAIYRLQFWDRQPLVPFVEGGGDAITFAEIRDDNKGPKFGLATAVHVAGGVSANLGLLDSQSLLNLDREFGINNVWLTLEYRVLVAINKKFDFSSNFFNGGILVEF